MIFNNVNNKQEFVKILDLITLIYLFINEIVNVTIYKRKYKFRLF